MDDAHGQEEYVRQVLEAYRKTPGTLGTVRRPDRLLAKCINAAFVESDRKRVGAGRHAPPDSTGQCAAPWHDSLAGLFPPGDQGSAGAARQSGLLRIPLRHKLARTRSTR